MRKIIKVCNTTYKGVDYYFNNTTRLWAIEGINNLKSFARETEVVEFIDDLTMAIRQNLGVIKDGSNILAKLGYK